MHVMDCSCAPILRFFYVASDGATANRQIPDRIFGSIFRLDALALSVIATATWLAGWVAGWLGGWLAVTLRYCIKTA